MESHSIERWHEQVLGYGQAITEVMQDKGITQVDVSLLTNFSNSYVSKVANNQRKAPKEMMRSAANRLDDPRLYFAAIHEVTGGAAPPWLDNVDLHPAAVAFKVLEEVEEAVVAIKAAPLSKRPEQLTAEDRQQIDEMMHEVREKVHAGMMLLGSMCLTYGISWAAQWAEHTKELKAKNYVK